MPTPVRFVLTCLAVIIGSCSDESPGVPDAALPVRAGSQAANAKTTNTPPAEAGETKAENRNGGEARDTVRPESQGQVVRAVPTQPAFIIEDCGEVDFPVTCALDESRQFFNQGIAQLHTHWYFEAARSFLHVLASEPDCAMAYWGLAMANAHSPKQAAAYMDRAVVHRHKASTWERRWIDSLAEYYEVTLTAAKARVAAVKLVDPITGPFEAASRRFKGRRAERVRKLASAVEGIVGLRPGDPEALAFYADLLTTELRSGRPLESRETVDALLARVFEARPMHPAHYCRVLLWEDADPGRALRSVRSAWTAAPVAANTWLASGRVLAKLHRHEDAAWYLEAAARTKHKDMARYHAMPHEVFDYGHGIDLLCQCLSHAGRARDALAWAKYLVDLPRHPTSNHLDDPASLCRRGMTRVAEVCRNFGMADELKRLEKRGYARPGRSDPECALLQSDEFLAAGEAGRALELLESHAAAHPDRVEIMTRKILALEAMGDRKRGRKVFERVRVIAGRGDIDVPLFDRLDVVAKSYGYPEDWRTPVARDPRAPWRPEHTEIGPAHWLPTPRHDWILPSADAGLIRSDSLRGGPRILVFFVSRGCCLSCVAQLHAYKAVAKDYGTAGIEVLPIGFHGVRRLKRALDDLGSYRFPFTILTDPHMRTWREWLVFNSYEHRPLHATFLLDAEGRVRWQDLGNHAFYDVRWLLEESKRLLAQ